MEPRVLILDEPTAGLDPSAHKEILSMIELIREKMGIIIIFVSHNMADIAALSDRIIVMDGGKIAMEGTPQEVFSHAEELSAMGLGVPPVREIMTGITAALPEIKSNALTADEAAEDIKKAVNIPKRED